MPKLIQFEMIMLFLSAFRGGGRRRGESEWTGKVKIRTRKKLLTASETCKDIS